MPDGSEYRAVCKEWGGRLSQPTCPVGGVAWGKPILFSAEDTSQPKQKTLIQNPIPTRGREVAGTRRGGRSGGFGEMDRHTGVGIGECIRQSKFRKPRA